MRWLGTLAYYVRSLVSRDRAEAELQDELHFHVERQSAEYVKGGMAPDEARLSALRTLGGLDQVKEEVRDTDRIPWLETLVQDVRFAIRDALWRDLRYGARLLRLNPAFAIVAILSLALGIGANTAIFQLLDAVQFRALPVKAAEQLVEIRPTMNSRWGNMTDHGARVTNAMWEQIRDQQQAFSGVFAWGVNRFDLSTGGESRLVDGLWVSGEFFDVLGVPPLVGRLLGPGDDMRGCGSPAAVISYAFWQREYGGAASTVGRTLRLDGHPFEIAGVTPASFFGVEVGRSFDVAIPICSEPIVEPARNAIEKRHYWWLDVFGRMKPGWTIEKTAAHLTAISPGIFAATVAPAFPPQTAKDFLALRLGAYPAATGVSSLRGAYQQPLWILLAVAALVLLIACANLANLMLARATAREREIAVRLAIGASRGRLVRQFLVESLMLASIGAALGVLVAQSLSRFLVSFISTDGQQLFVTLETDARVMAFTTALAAARCECGASCRVQVSCERSMFEKTLSCQGSSSRPDLIRRGRGVQSAVFLGGSILRHYEESHRPVDGNMYRSGVA